MKRTLLSLALVAGSLFTSSAFADPSSEAVLQVLKGKYPSTAFTAVRPSVMPGLFEVQMGRNLAYTDDQGRHFIFGAMYDMAERQDLTAARKAELGIQDTQPVAQQQKRAEPPPISWASLPLKDAFVRVNGKGERKLAIFSDPDCPYCKLLEKELDGLENVTIYTFMFPIASLHPGAQSKSEAIWCAGNDATRSKLWVDLLTKGKQPPKTKECATPVERNVALAESLGVRGTPTLITADGRRLPGMAPAARISAFMDAATATPTLASK